MFRLSRLVEGPLVEFQPIVISIADCTCKSPSVQIWVMAFCVTFVFTVTLSVFPAVTVDVKTVYPGKWGMSAGRACIIETKA